MSDPTQDGPRFGTFAFARRGDLPGTPSKADDLAGQAHSAFQRAQHSNDNARRDAEIASPEDATRSAGARDLTLARADPHPSFAVPSRKLSQEAYDTLRAPPKERGREKAKDLPHDR